MQINDGYGKAQKQTLTDGFIICPMLTTNNTNIVLGKKGAKLK